MYSQLCLFPVGCHQEKLNLSLQIDLCQMEDALKKIYETYFALIGAPILTGIIMRGIINDFFKTVKIPFSFISVHGWATVLESSRSSHQERQLFQKSPFSAEEISPRANNVPLDL